jgi:hypothetical protein
MESKALLAMAQVADKASMGTVIRVHDSRDCIELSTV